MRILPIILIAVLILIVLISGCTQTDGKNTQNASVAHPSSPTSAPLVTPSSGSDVTGKGGSEEQKYYYNIRIVPPSVLDQMQKEMAKGEYVIHNEQGDAIGIVSSQSLLLRGDLMQLEQNSGRSGKDFSKTDIANHVLDIAFGQDNSKLVLFKSDKDYEFWFDAYYTQSDVDYVLNLSKQLNTLSGTTQFKDDEVTRGFLNTNYAVIPYNYFNIHVISQKVIQDYYDHRTDGNGHADDHLIKNKDGVLIGLVAQNYLYLSDEVNEEDRHYYILKSLLYAMGMHGTSYTDKDSFFYRDEGANKELDDLDKEGIKLLYGGGLKSGMSLEETKKTLGLTT